ncbi:hypothetical protein JCM19052_3587 [Vibrio sp. JCM 19052]|nr:hypothetical protein JCM19052_3587 [Vibrio sp. JCM 19052]
MKTKEIGGYFEFDLTHTSKYIYKDGWHYKSARSAFYAFLLKKGIKEIYFPKYICNSMILPLKEIGVKVKFYGINHKFYPIISDYNNEYILYVNYFGVCDESIDEILVNFPNEKIIIDNSQAFFSKPRYQCAATLYSPRKFLPVPEGGTILTSTDLGYSGLSVTSTESIVALLKRSEEGAKYGYEDFSIASQKFDELSCDKISKFSYSLLNNIDSLNYLEIRRVNFNYLQQEFKDINLLKLADDIAPLCYPLKLLNNTKNIKKN